MKNRWVFKSLALTCLMFSLNSSGFSDVNKNISKCSSVKCLTDSKNLDVYANFLIWTVKEAGADCWAEVIPSDNVNFSNDIHLVNFGWDPGFRVGIGYRMNQNKWNTKFYYTRFNSQGNDKISSEIGSVHSAFLGNFYVDNQAGSGLSGPAYQKAKINWTLHFNMFDFDLGRNIWDNKPFAIYLFCGLKGGWINQFIHTKWINPSVSSFEYFNVGTENLKNNYCGVGPKFGVNSKWKTFRGRRPFYLLGDFSVALMWGHWTFSDKFKNDVAQEVLVDLQNINSGSTMFQSFLGFGWESNFNQNKNHFNAKIGYEMQFWLDQLQFYSFTGGRLVNMLTLQGGTFEFNFDF